MKKRLIKRWAESVGLELTTKTSGLKSTKLFLAILSIIVVYGASHTVDNETIYGALCLAVGGIYGTFAGFHVKQKSQGLKNEIDK